MEQERAFDTNALGNLANGKAGQDAATAVAHAHTFKGLKALTGAFGHLDLNAEGVSGAKLGYIGSQLFTIEFVDYVRHGRSLRGVRTCMTARYRRLRATDE